MKPKTNINLVAGIVVALAGGQRIYAGSVILGWAMIAVGLALVIQFFWLRRKRPDA